MYEGDDADMRYEDAKNAKLAEELAYLKKREDEQRAMAQESDGGGQIRPALETLGLQIEKAHALVAQLEDRLDTVLRPEDSNKPADPPSPTRPTSRLPRSCAATTPPHGRCWTASRRCTPASICNSKNPSRKHPARAIPTYWEKQ